MQRKREVENHIGEFGKYVFHACPAIFCHFVSHSSEMYNSVAIYHGDNSEPQLLECPLIGFTDNFTICVVAAWFVHVSPPPVVTDLW